MSMSNIDIRRFVNIDIKHSVTGTVNHERNEVVLFTKETNLNKETMESYSSFDDFKNGKFFTALGENAKNTDLYKYVAMYFTNGGIKLKVIKVDSYSDKTSFVSDVKAIIDKLGDKYIVYSYADYSNGTEFMIQLASELTSNVEKYSGIKQKIILARCSTSEIPLNIKEVNNLALKSSNVVGAEMTIGAYLSKINVYGVGTVQDYAFTRELSYSENVKLDEDITDEEFKQIMDANCNIDINLAGAVRNCGGNLTNGLDLVNQYVLIVLHQTLTDRILATLTNKIKGQTGLASIHTVMASEMDKYVVNGYLSLDKIWNKESVEITYNNQSYSIIESNTPLNSGYKIVILPFTSLTEDDIKKHALPPIYVILSDSYGIRYVTINGEVI